MTNAFYATPKCHTGNTIIYTEQKGGSLFIGGWTNGASFDYDTYVIDLTGTEHKYYDLPVAFDKETEAFLQFVTKPYAGWLSLPFPDMRTPQNLNKPEQWRGMADTIRKILRDGKDVLVACHGGHGRSGLFCAIVGYLLNINSDRSWSSPVEKIRKLHCDEAVETISQEQFVYNMLGLDIQIKRVYNQLAPTSHKYEKCPICGTQSVYVSDFGMCLGCQSKYRVLAPQKEFFTAADLKVKGEVDHSCDRPDCIGIWTAPKCKHVVHDMVILDGWCQNCKIAMNEADKEESDKACAVCRHTSGYSGLYGVCYDCAAELASQGRVDYVHNSLTDGYRAVPHYCNHDGCVGVVAADVCKHIVHNQDITDGLCEACRDELSEYYEEEE